MNTKTRSQVAIAQMIQVSREIVAANSPAEDASDQAVRVASLERSWASMRPPSVRCAHSNLTVWRRWALEHGVLGQMLTGRCIDQRVQHLVNRNHAIATLIQHTAFMLSFIRIAYPENVAEQENLAQQRRRLEAMLTRTSAHNAAALGLAEIQSILERLDAGNLKTVRLAAFALLSYDTMARPSEILGTRYGKGDWQTLPLTFADLKWCADGSGRVKIRNGRTLDKVDSLQISPMTVTALQRWLSASGVTDGPIFREVSAKNRATSKPLRPDNGGREILSIVPAVAKSATVRLDSFRLGGMRDRLAKGQSVADVLATNRWSRSLHSMDRILRHCPQTLPGAPVQKLAHQCALRVVPFRSQSTDRVQLDLFS